MADPLALIALGVLAIPATILSHRSEPIRRSQVPIAIELPSKAEQNAQQASKYKAFSGLNLRQIREDLKELLGLIRANGLFEEYTNHDISHIDRMLVKLDWLIPADTQQIMTPADWLLIVLSAYFHDLGMLVTRDEYDERYSTAFAIFKDDILNSQETAAKDLAARIKVFDSDTAERFLYQEYVREHHAARVRNWISGQSNSSLGITPEMSHEMNRMLGSLEPVFREDLAIVCESHHLDDLGNTKKYPISRPYGDSSAESANVQYAAVILRTMDLLDITADRTPSIAFRIISPRDPISQGEWAKQNAVRNVRAQVSKNGEGNLDPELPRDTIEVHARYEDAEGFFGLNSYLTYAEGQIRQSFNWISQSNRRFHSEYMFPWRDIDQSQIETRGFIDRPFAFTLDQDRILELLTGHTLYNDSSVVLRELIQNALDAVRLAYGDEAGSDGKIQVSWDSKRGVLEVKDNGTGMTQEIIEQNFLHVGASYYQSSQFKKEHPEFSPISRFGIGVLSAFMVADQVEVTTSHKDEPQARKLELRTVHGRYLIRLLDKQLDPDAKELGDHGTVVRLHLRPSAKIEDVRELAEQWIVVPNARVEISEDGRAPEQVGYDSLQQALEAIVERNRNVLFYGSRAKLKYKIVERELNGVSIAYAVRWNDYFKEWTFVNLPSAFNRQEENDIVLGTCIEGIRVQFGVPGFDRVREFGVVAIANFSGSGAPHTNVARSTFESTPDHRSALKKIYALYVQNVTEELRALERERKRSLTGAVAETPYLLSNISDLDRADEPDELRSALAELPMLVLEDDGSRFAVSVRELGARDFYWTIEGGLPQYMETLLREIPVSISLNGLLSNLGSLGIDLPSGTILCKPYSHSRDTAQSLLAREWQVGEIHGKHEQRRCETKWIKLASSPLWSPVKAARHSSWPELASTIGELADRYGSDLYSRGTQQVVRIPIGDVPVSGFGHADSAVRVGSEIYLLPGNEWLKILITDSTKELPSDRSIEALSLLLMVNSLRSTDVIDERIYPMIARTDIGELLDVDLFREMTDADKWNVFDVRRWWRNGPGVF